MRLQPLTLAEVAQAADATLDGDPAGRIWFGARLEDATPQALSFFDGRQSADALGRTRAGAVLVPDSPASLPAVPPGAALLRSVAPHRSFLAVVAALWQRRALPPATIAATATVHPTATVSAQAHVGPGAVIGAGARVGSGAALHPNSVVGDQAVIGPGTMLGAGAVVGPGVLVGARCVVHSGARLGFASRPSDLSSNGQTKPASFGGVIIGDDVEIGPNAVIEEGERTPTTIADGVRIGALCYVGHDSSIAGGAELVAMVGLASQVQVGAQALLMGQVGVTGGVRIGDRAVVFGKSGVIGNVPDDGQYMGNPAWPRSEWLRTMARLRHGTRTRMPQKPGPTTESGSTTS